MIHNIDQISLNDIKTLLINRYQKNKENLGPERKLLVWQPQNPDGNCYFFAIEGTPPKGYGIYIPEQRSLLLYDVTGKLFKQIYTDKGVIFQ